MPYRNVYEERQSVGRALSQEPERDPKKIAQIYRSQLPSADEFALSGERLVAHEKKIETAFTLNRGIKKK